MTTSIRFHLDSIADKQGSLLETFRQKSAFFILKNLPKKVKGEIWFSLD
jgi:hypothetical protein